MGDDIFLNNVCQSATHHATTVCQAVEYPSQVTSRNQVTNLVKSTNSIERSLTMSEPHKTELRHITPQPFARWLNILHKSHHRVTSHMDLNEFCHAFSDKI